MSDKLKGLLTKLNEYLKNEYIVGVCSLYCMCLCVCLCVCVHACVAVCIMCVRVSMRVLTLM